MLFKPLHLILLFLLSINCFADSQREWELLRQEDGIVVHRDLAYAKGIIPVKASMIVSQSIEEIVAVILDTKRKAEWAPRVPAVTIIKKNSPYDIIEYAQLAFPWPFSDRYFIVRSGMKATPQLDKVTFFLKSIEDDYVPKDKNYVRGHVYNGGMEIEKVGKNVKVTAHLFTDPKGSIPNWVVNMFSEKTSVKFMQSLRKQISKGLYDKKRLIEVSRHIQHASDADSDRLPATREKSK